MFVRACNIQLVDCQSVGKIVPSDMRRRIIVKHEEVWHRLQAQKKRGCELQAGIARDEAFAALRCKRGDLRTALDAKRRTVCIHHTSQGPIRVKSARLSVINLRELDELIASDRYSTRDALA